MKVSASLLLTVLTSLSILQPSHALWCGFFGFGCNNNGDNDNINIEAACTDLTRGCPIPQGPRGPPGKVGESIQGKQGSKGDMGPVGNPGVYMQGTTVVNTIKVGEPGNAGETGEKGASGVTGIKGNTGTPGSDGADAAQGKIGDVGFKGKLGPQGPPGIIIQDAGGSSIGPPGDVGDEGPVGASGADGSDGAQGETGPSGKDGKDGSDGTDGATGPRGEEGPLGNPGDPGPNGASFKGRTGETGETGGKGPNGISSDSTIIFRVLEAGDPQRKRQLVEDPVPILTGITSTVGESAPISLVQQHVGTHYITLIDPKCAILCECHSHCSQEFIDCIENEFPVWDGCEDFRLEHEYSQDRYGPTWLPYCYNYNNPDNENVAIPPDLEPGRGNYASKPSSNYGDVTLWHGSATAVPYGYAILDGRSLNKVVFRELYKAIGDAYTQPDLVEGDIFNLPDMRDHVPVGANAANALGTTKGNKEATMSIGQMPKHKHGVFLGNLEVEITTDMSVTA